MRHVAQAHRHPGIGRGEGDAAEVFERAEVTRSADHVLCFGKLEHRAAGLLVRVLDRADDLAVRDVERAQALRIEHHLVLAHHAAQRCDFGHVRHGLELVLQEPVLQRAQLRDVQPVTPVDERVLVDPADAGRIRAERGPRFLRQARLHLVQILEYPRAGPVQVRAVLEQDVDERIAEHGVTAYGLRAGDREHGGGERIGDLVLDDLRSLPGIGGADDHLHVGEVGEGIEGSSERRPQTPRRDRRDPEKHQEPVGDAGADEPGDHHCRRASVLLRLASESIRN